MDTPETRPGELAGPLPDRVDATLTFLGRIRTPFATRADCPRRGSVDGPLCRLEIDPPWRPALLGVEPGMRLEVLYWMHLARRDLLVQVPRRNPVPRGSFALRAPNRPNPVSTSIVVVEAVTEEAVMVRGLDCVDGTPLIDIKPDFRREEDAPGGG